MSELKAVNFTIVPDPSTAPDRVYANFCAVSQTPFDVTLKKFYRENGKVRLQPANPTMQPIMVEPDRVQVQGVVVGVMRKY